MKDVKALAIKMVEAYLDGFRIKAIGGIVFTFKEGVRNNGAALMNTTDALACRDWLSANGISMRRIDAGGSPEWEFVVDKHT